MFLDRDGTINVKPPEHEYVTAESDFVWLPGAPEALARLADSGFVLTIVSNQRGVARGLVEPGLLDRIEQRIQQHLARYGCAISAFAYCTHDLADACDCRKPKPGLILRLADRLQLDLAPSWVIGDSVTDVQAGLAAGCRTALVANARRDTRADVVAPSIAEISEIVTRQAARA